MHLKDKAEIREGDKWSRGDPVGVFIVWLLALLPSWLLVSTADLTSSHHCPVQNASWLLTNVLKGQGQMPQAGTQDLPSFSHGYSSFISPSYQCTPSILAAFFSVSQPSEPWSIELHPPEQPSPIFEFTLTFQGPAFCGYPIWRVLPCRTVNHPCTVITEHQHLDVCVCAPYPSGPPQCGIRSRAQPNVLLPALLEHVHCEGRAVITLTVQALRKLRFWEVGHTSPSSSWVNPPKDLSMSTQEAEEEEGSEQKDEFLSFLKNI